MMMLPGTLMAQPASGSKVWLRADVDVVVSSSTTTYSVSQWMDQSGNGNHAWMTTASRQPSLVLGAINGLPLIRFDGSQSLILTTPVSHNQFTYFIVGKNSKPAETFSMILGPNGKLPNNQLRWESGTRTLAVGTGNDMPHLFSTVRNTRVNHLLTVRYDGLTFSVYYNGLLISNSTLLISGPWTLGQIGAWYSTHFMTGDIAEIVMYNTGLTSADCNTTTSYLRSKYRLPESLEEENAKTELLPLGGRNWNILGGAAAAAAAAAVVVIGKSTTAWTKKRRRLPTR
jgi:hypothetical protein